MISDLVQQLGVGGGGEGGLTNTNFYPTTFRVQYFHISNINALKKWIFYVLQLGFQKNLDRSLLHVTHSKLIHAFFLNKYLSGLIFCFIRTHRMTNIQNFKGI